MTPHRNTAQLDIGVVSCSRKPAHSNRLILSPTPSSTHPSHSSHPLGAWRRVGAAGGAAGGGLGLRSASSPRQGTGRRAASSAVAAAVLFQDMQWLGKPRVRWLQKPVATVPLPIKAMDMYVKLKRRAKQHECTHAVAHLTMPLIRLVKCP